MAAPVGISDAEILSQTLVYALAGKVLDEALQGREIRTNWLELIQGIRLWLGCHDSAEPLSWLYQMDEIVHQQVTHDATLQMMHSATALTYHADARIQAAATLIAYATNRYGTQTLPILLAALSQYDSWQSLIPAVYGVSAEQFEQGWQEYTK
jgi:hypothetical protein